MKHYECIKHILTEDGIYTRKEAATISAFLCAFIEQISPEVALEEWQPVMMARILTYRKPLSAVALNAALSAALRIAKTVPGVEV